MGIDLQLLSGKLTKYRQQFEVSFQELAEATGISLANLIDYESGEPLGVTSLTLTFRPVEKAFSKMQKKSGLTVRSDLHKKFTLSITSWEFASRRLSAEVC